MVNGGSKSIVRAGTGKAGRFIAESELAVSAQKHDLVCFYPFTCYPCIDKVVQFPDINNSLCNCFAVPLSPSKKLSCAGCTFLDRERSITLCRI